MVGLSYHIFNKHFAFKGLSIVHCFGCYFLLNSVTEEESCQYITSNIYVTRRSSRSSGLCYSLGVRNRWQQVITGDLLLLPSNGHGREALVPRVYSAFKMAALSG